MGSALEDILVLDLGQIYNGPYCSMLLAFQGAKVIKVEPPTGEVLRRRRRAHTDKEPHEFLMLNSNKSGITLDLKSEAGKRTFTELVKRADVVVENFAPGVMDRLGLGYDVLRELNPRLVYAASSGYGSTGPYSRLPAMDLTIQAMGGVMATTGYANDSPLKAGPAFGDFSGGVHLFGGIVTALYQRERTGRGQRVEVSMHDSIYPTLASPLGAHYDRPGQIPPRTGNRHSGLAQSPYNVYPTADGHIAIFCISERHWAALATYMVRPDLVADPRFATGPDRARNMDDLDEIISSWTAVYGRWELAEGLLEQHVPCAPVLSLAEVAQDEHLKARGMLREVEHPDYGRVVVPGSPIRLSESPLEQVRPAPRLGEHTEQVLGELLDGEAATYGGS